MACGLSLATQSDMCRACQVFRIEELAEKLGFEFTLDLLGDDQVAGATRSGNEDRSVRSAAAVLKNHARSYMKQPEKRLDFAPASGNGRSLRILLLGPGSYTQVHALGYCLGKHRPPECSAHKGGDPDRLHETVSGSNLYRCVGSKHAQSTDRDG